MKKRNRTLLISYYWQPWNNAGAFRWLHLSKFLNLHSVFTSEVPEKGFKDITMPKGSVDLILRFTHFPAVIWGVIITLPVMILSLWYNKVIFTISPESLLVPAYILQLFKKKVYVDYRDDINRSVQPHKRLIPIYQWLWSKINKKCVTTRFFDESAILIRHGYDIDRSEKYNNNFLAEYYANEYLMRRSYNYAEYCNWLKHGGGS